MADGNTIDAIYDEFQRCIDNCNACPRLEEISLTSVAISLWTTKDIKDRIKVYFTEAKTKKTREREWRRIEKVVTQQSRQVPLYRAFKEDYECTIANISVQIREWVDNLRKYTRKPKGAPIDYINDIVWTNRGTIDKEKTFLNLYFTNKKLVSDGSLYNLAHYLFLTDKIPILEVKLSESTRERFQDERMSVINYRLLSTVDKIISRKGFLPSLREDSVFSSLVIEGHDLAVKKIWNLEKVPDYMPLTEFKSKFLFRVHKLLYRNSHGDIFYFFLTHLPKKKFKKIVMEEPYFILRGLAYCDRPWRTHLLPFVEKLLPLFNADDLTDVMLDILDIITMTGCNEVLIKQFFLFLWKKSEKSVRDFILNCKLFNLLNESDFEFFRDFLKNESHQQKWTVLVSQKSKEWCFYAVITKEFPVEDFLDDVFKEKGVVCAYKKELAVYGLKELKVLLERNRCEMFYKWCLKDDEIVKFKLKFFVFDFVEKTISEVGVANIRDFDGFLRWCLLSEDEVNRLQKKFNKNN